MKRLTRFLFLAIAIIGIRSHACWADISLPAVISNHMVLQRDQPVPIWGWANPGERVTVTFAGADHVAETSESGRWQVTFPNLAASTEPRSIRIKGSTSPQIEVTDVLVGEVWFSTGPSNIFWPVRKCDNAEQEIASATFPDIRFFTVERKTADLPQETCAGNWLRCSPQTVGEVSGIAYFFSRRIHHEIDVPVGVLQSYWGGSRVEAWTSREALEEIPSVKPILDWWNDELSEFDPAAKLAREEQQLQHWKRRVATAKSAGLEPPKQPSPLPDPQRSHHRPASLFNGMVAPLIPFAIRGVICYQGLGNLLRANLSAPLLDTMIRDWRQRWQLGNFPIGMVQPAPFDCSGRASSGPDAYSVQREAQLIVQSRLKNIGIAPTSDIDDINTLHFTDKQRVGHRLASWALASVYGIDVPYTAPTLKSISVEGDSIRVQFNHSGSGLTTNDGQPPRHFDISGSDDRFVPANASIDGDSVVVRSEHVANPVAVRFAFSDTAVVNLVNSEGLPASLFRRAIETTK